MIGRTFFDKQENYFEVARPPGSQLRSIRIYRLLIINTYPTSILYAGIFPKK